MNADEMAAAGRPKENTCKCLVWPCPCGCHRPHGVVKTRDAIGLADTLRAWAQRAKSAQIALDLSKEPEDVAIRAGQLQDLSEDILRVAATL